MSNVWITIPIILVIGVQLALGRDDQKTICRSGALNCSDGKVIYVSQTVVSGTEPPRDTHRDIITSALRNCNIRQNCTINIGGYCLNISYYCAKPDWNIVELLEDQIISETIDDYKFALQSKGYDKGLYQTAFNADCQLSLQGEPVVKKMYLLTTLFDFGPYVEFDFAEDVRYCLTIQGAQSEKFCTGDKTPRRPPDEYLKLPMKGTRPNWTVNLSFRWEGNAVADQRKIQTGIGFRLNMALFGDNHEFAITPAKKMTCQTMAESTTMYPMTSSPSLAPDKAVTEAQALMVRKGLPIPVEVVLACGGLAVIIVFIISFAIISRLFRRASPINDEPPSTEGCTDAQASQEVGPEYASIDDVPAVPKSNRPTLKRHIDEEGMWKSRKPEAHVCMIHGKVPFPQNRLADKAEHKVTDYLDMNCHKLPPCQGHILYHDMRGTKGKDRFDDEAADINYTVMTLQKDMTKSDPAENYVNYNSDSQTVAQEIAGKEYVDMSGS